MNDELTARQRAISLRLAGRSVKHIGLAVGRTEAGFHRWWRRYLEAGPDGLYDLTRANHQVARRIPPELERTILSIRRRLQAHATPATRYRLTGAAAIRAELRTLGVRPLPCERTIGRVLERNGLTAPRVRLAPLLPRQEWPGSPAPPPAASGGPGPQGPRLKGVARGRSGGPDLPKGQRPPLLHLGGQGCFRRRCLPAPGRLPPHGRGPLVPRRVLEGSGPAGA